MVDYTFLFPLIFTIILHPIFVYVKRRRSYLVSKLRQKPNKGVRMTFKTYTVYLCAIANLRCAFCLMEVLGMVKVLFGTLHLFDRD